METLTVTSLFRNVPLFRPENRKVEGQDRMIRIIPLAFLPIRAQDRFLNHHHLWMMKTRDLQEATRSARVMVGRAVLTLPLTLPEWHHRCLQCKDPFCLYPRDLCHFLQKKRGVPGPFEPGWCPACHENPMYKPEYKVIPILPSPELWWENWVHYKSTREKSESSMWQSLGTISL